MRIFFCTAPLMMNENEESNDIHNASAGKKQH